MASGWLLRYGTTTWLMIWRKKCTEQWLNYRWFKLKLCVRRNPSSFPNHHTRCRASMPSNASRRNSFSRSLQERKQSSEYRTQNWDASKKTTLCHSCIQLLLFGAPRSQFFPKLHFQGKPNNKPPCWQAMSQTSTHLSSGNSACSKHVHLLSNCTS